MINKMTETKRIDLLGNGRDTPKSKAAAMMYGPALIGASMRNGHIAALPEIGDKLTATKTGQVITITAIVYGADRNVIRCTCESNGQTAVRNWEELLKNIESGTLASE